MGLSQLIFLLKILTRQGAIRAISVNRIELPDFIGTGVGPSWGVYRQELMTRLAGRVSYCEIDNLPRASAIARLGAWDFERGLAVSVEQAMPVYLRDKVAKKESER
jgi:tRNA threonylcarbamoyladenosine biosynthesis protein TsaB